MMPRWVPEVAHQAGLVPLVALILFAWKAPHAYWILAAAFALSWVGDSASHFYRGSWDPSFLWLPIQLSLAVAAFRGTGSATLWSAVAIAAVAIIAQAFPGQGHDWPIILVGSALVLAFARGPLALPARIYFGVGTLAYLVMVANLDALRAGDVRLWYAYQSCRLATYLAFVGAVVYQRRHPWPTC